MSTNTQIGRNHALKVWEDAGSPSVPIPIEKIVKAHGISVRFSPFDDELSGMATIKDGVKIIGVNALHHPNRQRFTLAHELGHHIMHQHLLDGTVHVDKGFSLWRGELAGQGIEAIEIQANNFASELLLPKPLIENMPELLQHDFDDEVGTQKFAKRLRVSAAALQYRVRALG